MKLELSFVPIFGALLLIVSVVVALPTNRLDLGHAETMEEMPEDVLRFEEFLMEYDAIMGLIHTGSRIRENSPLEVLGEEAGAGHLLHLPEQSLRKKRQVGDAIDVSGDFSPEPQQQAPTSIYVSDDERGKVRAELNRIFQCYHRLRCGITRQQAEQDCKWLESSELYHQIMRVLGVREYPKKPMVHRGQRRRHSPPPTPTTTTTTPGPVGPGGQQPMSDAEMNPVHVNLRNGITHAKVFPGQYLPSSFYPPKNRRAYDSFFTQPNSPTYAPATAN